MTTGVIDLEGDGKILSMELVGNVFLNLGVNEGLRICSAKPGNITLMVP